MSDLTPTQIAAWFRQQAAQFTQVADMVEATFKGGAPAPSAPAKNGHVVERLNGVTANEIKSAIRLKGMRMADAAKHFHVPAENIEDVVKLPGSGLIIGDRGWIKETPPTTS